MKRFQSTNSALKSNFTYDGQAFAVAKVNLLTKPSMARLISVGSTKRYKTSSLRKYSMEGNMDFDKIRYELQSQFNSNSLDEGLIGKLASAYMETRDFERAYEILKYGVEIIPCIQTLTNLGYFYLYEGEPNGEGWRYREDKAITVLEKAVNLNPQSHIPYSVLGEAYLTKNEDSKAEFVLKKAIEIEQTSANLNNLGVALYRQNKFKEAKVHFYNSHLKRKLKHYTFRPYLNYGMTLAKLGIEREAETVAKYLLNNGEDKTFEVDTVDIINIYYEIKDLNKVTELYPIAFEEVAISPQDFEMYIFALKQLGYENTIDKLFIDTLKDKDELIKDIIEDDEIDEESKKYQVTNAFREITEFRNSYDKVKRGKIIQSYYQPFIEKDCYLFGCLRHKNPVYSEIIKVNAAKGDFL